MHNCGAKNFPKINISFKRISTPIQAFAAPTARKNDFLSLIPDKISKQVLRLKRFDDEANAAMVEMKDGTSVKPASLLELRANKESFIKEKKLSNSKNNYVYRKLRLSSSIHEELIAFFSSSHCPKILKFDKGIWSITEVRCLFKGYYLPIIQVNLTESIERADINWCLSAGVDVAKYQTVIEQNLKKIEGAIRQNIASKISIKSVPAVNFVYQV
jgi:hypothetical protein